MLIAGDDTAHERFSPDHDECVQLAQRHIDQQSTGRRSSAWMAFKRISSSRAEVCFVYIVGVSA